MSNRYTSTELPKNLMEFLSLLNAPDHYPQLGTFSSRLIDILNILIKHIPIDDELKQYLEDIRNDVISLDNNKLLSHSDYQLYQVKDTSQFYYLIIKLDGHVWRESLQLCCSIFLHGLLINKFKNTPLKLTNQNLIRLFLTTPTPFPNTENNIFDVYQALDTQFSAITFSEEHISKVLSYFNRLAELPDYTPTGVKMFIKLINNLRLNKTSTNIKPYAGKNKREGPFTPPVGVVSRKKLDPFIEEGGEVEHNTLLEVNTKDQNKILTIGELAKWSRVRLRLHNHYIQNHNNALNDLEAKALFDFLLNSYEKKEEDIPRLSIALMLLIGLDITWLKSVVIVQVFPSELMTNKVYIRIDGLIYFNTLSLDKAYSTSVTQKPWLNGNHTKWLSQLLPQRIIPLLSKAHQKNLGDIDNISATQKLFDKIRSHLGRRFTLNRVREYIFNSIYRISQDEVIAHYLIPFSNFTPPSGCYYTSIPTDYAYNLQKEVLEGVFGNLVNVDIKHYAEKETYIGSELNIDLNKIRDWLDSLKGKLSSLENKTRTLSELINYHNNYVNESPRVHRRPVCLSQATLPDSFKLS